MAHWADALAQEIIAAKGDKASYTLASGITPSGTIHFGKFREIIMTDLVARALIKLGKKVRFIYSWDDYDTFRKVPSDMPMRDMLESRLYEPIVDIPDPFGVSSSYAGHNEEALEAIAPSLGIDYVEYVYQAKKYRSRAYNESIIVAMDSRDKIAGIMAGFKSGELAPGWQPLEAYCEECNRDRMAFGRYDSAAKKIGYECKLCGHKGELDLRESRRLKLPWRIDWPMRWAYEDVDFEPGGRDHSSATGSRDTGEVICREIYGREPPVYSVYEQIRVKGQTKKMSSSSGNVLSLESVLAVYEPEIVRWFFASYKPTAPFDMAFDLDVLKNYEEFDQAERKAYEGDEYFRRVYELSQLGVDGSIPPEMPFQPSFRHLCNIIQVNGFDMEKTRGYYAGGIRNSRDERRFAERSARAKYWLENHAPADFRFMLNASRRVDVKPLPAVERLRGDLAGDWDALSDEKALQERLSAIVADSGMSAKEVYRNIYQLLISRDSGPKLAGFIGSIGREKILDLL
ncbi:MAG: lysine--tRNA ligase [Rickettsiales bacterium]|jgi:lysyl-tRNA synthetase class 1|nr:lysine--tRNA ligase [Rickettsiales bacterium]